ncbi:beta-galactosidase [Paenibacillus mucilaginosus 3016]|uniref:Beta-galactosidase n=1 Tax=Paenibacillus mucilaginosus 3016 TaxID=1116391 RepID=H6NDN5_9BACL|nr:beta-galactosidase family protein [Paenibacillus mucilaginosus]AFC31375.1 beta-galactosidase [Paenibacillus mucilaginosus 3016]WFA19931.1 beta-galactosidase [Paenibacillus mucilaginosus]
MAVFGIEQDRFTYDGEEIRLYSGAIHYFRIVPEYWEDRLRKLKACGFNTVETYVPWNLHEPQEGRFVFEGMADLERFIRLAGRLGLHVIVRPSPYICAEWEFGGLPAWLLAEPGMKLRCADPLYLSKVDAYYDELIPRLVPLLCTSGGPVILVQVENEYGSYGSDKAYLEHLRDGLVRRGIDVPLFTSDGPTDSMLQGGSLPGVLATVNFGSRTAESFAKLREYQPQGPLMCMEYWNGWFDHWMEEHHQRDAADAARVFGEMLEAGASVNFYMFHGGTNFGFHNGANHIKTYEPTITSYDYDSPLTEWGEPTAKYYAVRDVLAEHLPLGAPELPEPIPRRTYGTVRVTERADLFAQLDRLSSPVTRPCPETMERLGQAYGFVLYRTRISGPRTGQVLHVQEVRDRAQVFLDGTPAGVVERWDPQGLPVTVPEGGAALDILVENMGRINYGPLLSDAKGITCGVRLDNQFQYGWTMYGLPLDSLEGVAYEPLAEGEAPGGPAFYRAAFEVDEPADTFVRLDGWTKGVVFINGFHLGRYWERGPQKTLYLPGPLLRRGTNELVVFELHGAVSPELLLTEEPDLGSAVPVVPEF